MPFSNLKRFLGNCFAFWTPQNTHHMWGGHKSDTTTRNASLASKNYITPWPYLERFCFPDIPRYAQYRSKHLPVSHYKNSLSEDVLCWELGLWVIFIALNKDLISHNKTSNVSWTLYFREDKQLRTILMEQSFKNWRTFVPPYSRTKESSLTVDTLKDLSETLYFEQIYSWKDIYNRV